jgi:hypothetical protein
VPSSKAAHLLRQLIFKHGEKKHDNVPQVASKCSISLVVSTGTNVKATFTESNDAPLVPSQVSDYLFLVAMLATIVMMAMPSTRALSKSALATMATSKVEILDPVVASPTHDVA